MPKYHWLPFFDCDISGSRRRSLFFVEGDAANSVASDGAPRSSSPLAARCSETAMKQAAKRLISPVTMSVAPSSSAPPSEVIAPPDDVRQGPFHCCDEFASPHDSIPQFKTQRIPGSSGDVTGPMSDLGQERWVSTNNRSRLSEQQETSLTSRQVRRDGRLPTSIALRSAGPPRG